MYLRESQMMYTLKSKILQLILASVMQLESNENRRWRNVFQHFGLHFERSVTDVQELAFQAVVETQWGKRN